MIISSLMRCTNIYDVMLWSFEQVKNNNFQNIVTTYEPKKYKYISDIVVQFIEDSMINKIVAFSNLKAQLCNLYRKKNFDIYEYYTIINTIDKRCECDFCDVIEKECIEYYGINATEEFNSFVLPRLDYTFLVDYDNAMRDYEKNNNIHGDGLRKKHKENNGEINDYLHNYIIFNADMKYKVCLHRLNKNMDFFKNFKENKKFSLFINPILNMPINEVFDIHESKTSFYVNGIKEGYKERILNEITDTINSEDEIDITLFPELFFTGMNEDDIALMILNGNKDYDKLIYMGSASFERNNKCAVYTSNRNKLFEQHKKTSFSFNNKLEDLSNADNLIHVIEVEDFGRVSIIICKDCMNTDINKILRELQIDLNLIVAYSPSLEMKAYSEELAKHSKTTTVFCNSCSAVAKKTDKIGYITLPVKNATFSDYHNIYYGNADCLKCDKCNGYQLNIYYNQIELYDGKKMGVKVEIFKKSIENI